jgi:hypothetical protein
VRFKKGVDPFGIRPEVAMWLPTLETIWVANGADELVITSICDGHHARQSQHRDGFAVDIRTKTNHPNGGGLPSREAKRRAVWQVAQSCSDEYYIDLEHENASNEHVHFHYRRK